ncbi:hypothetical protein BDN71DRAFT_1445851 [Pleurotus eryngii]|uniref:C3H1-type domain-containing protein n=1 Tax=Pleurotus eryngii TaxID=5323 RepID=A0A9P5ZZR3_PLEER|nr:hypothetical protein BDN71DRAFT_1445851 [Pleurotus eryngii]
MSTFQACHQFADTTCTYGGKCKFQHIRESATPSSVSTLLSERPPSFHDVSHLQPASSPPRKKAKEQHSNASSQFTTFDDYPDFDYDPGNYSIREFHRLCDSNGWERKDPERKKAYQVFKDALVKEFNGIYDTDENDIDSWALAQDMHRLGHTPLSRYS